MIIPLLVAIATLVPSGYVNDYAQMLRPETVANLELQLSQFKQETGNEIAVVTIDTHGTDETIESAAVKLFEKWKIGKAEPDNGLLLLIARDDREVRIEVGYGLEPYVTDIESGRIISDVIVPAFKEGKYDEGIVGAVERITSDIRNGGAPIIDSGNIPEHLYPDWMYALLVFVFFGIRFLGPMAQSKSWWAGGILGGVIGLIALHTFSSILIAIGVGLLIDFLLSRRYGGQKFPHGGGPWWWGGGPGGSGGGSFGGFGGGSSGGGGASGRW